MIVLVCIPLAVVALGAAIGWAWQWRRDTSWVQYGRQRWSDQAAMADVADIRHDAEAAMLRAVTERRRAS